MKPTVGRTVHVHMNAYDQPVAAIITGVLSDDRVHLCVFIPGQLPGYADSPTPFSETPKKGYWTWPPREEA